MTPLAVLLMEAVLSLRFGDATYIAFSNPVSIGDSTYTINRQKASSRPHCASRWRQCLRSPDQKDARVMRAPTRGSKTDFVPRRPLSSEPRQLRVASACLIRKLRALDLARTDLPLGAGAYSPEPGGRSDRTRGHTDR